MRNATVQQAAAEIKVLDQIRGSLEKAIRNRYEEISLNNPRFGGHRGDMEIAARSRGQTY